jgi:hypothetical protein
MFERSGNKVGSLSTVVFAVASGVGAAAAPAQAAWSTPASPSPACTPASGLNVSRNGTGTWILAGTFTQSDGTAAVETCTSSDGVSWSGPTMVGPGTNPAVVLAPGGRAVVVFTGPFPAINVQASVRPPGGNWSAPVVISSGTFSSRLTLKMDGTGNAIAVWSASTNASPLATASLAANRTSWTPVKTLDAHAGSFGVATNASGGVVVSFRNNHPDNTEAVSGTILGGFGAPVVVGSNYGTAIRPTQVALNDAGEAVLGWVTDDFAKVVTRDAAGTWSAATQLAGLKAEGIGVAIDAAGNALAGFGEHQATLGSIAVYASKLRAGGTWGPAALLSALDAKGRVAVGGDPAGTVVVTWLDGAGNTEALTIPPGGSFGPGTVVATGSASSVTVLTVFPGEAVLIVGTRIAEESVN